MERSPMSEASTTDIIQSSMTRLLIVRNFGSSSDQADCPAWCAKAAVYFRNPSDFNNASTAELPARIQTQSDVSSRGGAIQCERNAGTVRALTRAFYQI